MKTFTLMQKGGEDLQIIGVEEFEKIFKIDYLPSLSYKMNLKPLCPYILRLPFISSVNWELGEHYASLLEQGFFAKTSIRWINPSMGYGLFAEEDFPANTFIGEYTGQVRELDRKNPDHNAYCVHYPTRFWSMRYLVIDAQKRGNEARFVNHSDHPNLTVKCLIKDNILHFAFFTEVAVGKREELRVDYGHDYWKKRQKLINP